MLTITPHLPLGDTPHNGQRIEKLKSKLANEDINEVVRMSALHGFDNGELKRESLN